MSIIITITMMGKTIAMHVIIIIYCIFHTRVAVREQLCPTALIVIMGHEKYLVFYQHFIYYTKYFHLALEGVNTFKY